MNNWIETPLEQLADISSGGTPSRAIDDFWGGDIPWATPSDITRCKTNYLYDTREFITQKGLLSSSAKLLPTGTLLFTSRATIGEIKISTKQVSTNQGFKNLVPKECIDTNFLFYQIVNLKNEFVKYAAGSTFLEINRKDTGRVLIPHPVDKNKQYKIGHILHTIDRTITHTEALIEKYQQIKAGLMHDLFTRGIGADGKLRPTRDKAPELYQESSIGWIPKEWNYAQLKHYVRSAQYGISTSLGDAQTGIPVLRMNNIKSNIFDVCDLKYTNDSEAYKIKLKKGDVLYNRTNSMEHVGKIAIWRNELPECSFASYLVRINLHENIILPDFFSHWMSQISSQNALRRYATPAVQQVNINPTNLQKIWISCPHSIEEQRQISERIDMVDLKLKAEKTALDKLRSKKSGLMHDLLTGTVRVNIDPV
jgi:type I restriction enzyme, S subunit